jgi:ribosomal protein S18 acetylase RimI-like enzyme
MEPDSRMIPDMPGQQRNKGPSGRAERLRSAVIVPYDRSMRRNCLEIFDLNMPVYFAAKERVLLEEFLDTLPCQYLVMLMDGIVAACGGYFVLPEERIAGLCWGMVRPELQRMGIGKRMLLTRLHIATARCRVDRVILDTSQKAEGFFAHFGFEKTASAPDGYAPGLDRVEMSLPMDLRARRNLVRRCSRLGYRPPPGFEYGAPGSCPARR